MKISVSFIKSIYDIKTTIKKIDESTADYIHVDLMDGKFVKNKNFTAGEITKLLGNKNKPLDVHLMVSKPDKWLNTFAELNTEYLTFHFETIDNPKEFINEISSYGLKVGISIKPKTKIDKIKDILPLVDQVLVMSVEPGKGGQEFLESSQVKIQLLKKLKEENNYHYLISVDGGINNNTASLVKNAGAEMLVSGSFICSEEDFDKKIELLR